MADDAQDAGEDIGRDEAAVGDVIALWQQDIERRSCRADIQCADGQLRQTDLEIGHVHGPALEGQRAGFQRDPDKIAANAVREGQHRIEAMSMIHQRLYTHDNITEVNIKEYITDLSESLMLAYGYSRDNFVLKLHIENEMMNVDKAIPLSLIINELVTNAFKYAFESIEKPTLTITLSKAQSDIQLFIADNGKGIDMLAWQTNKGYGKELVQTFTKQLDGEMSVEVDNGTTFKISFPNYLLDIN